MFHCIFYKVPVLHLTYLAMVMCIDSALCWFLVAILCASFQFPVACPFTYVHSFGVIRKMESGVHLPGAFHLLMLRDE